jgi:hypothetical protein
MKAMNIMVQNEIMSFTSEWRPQTDYERTGILWSAGNNDLSGPVEVSIR